MERFSFIPQGTKLKKILSRSQLDALMRECEKEVIPTLRNLDLSDLDNCDNLNFDGYHLQNIVFSRFRPDKNEKKLLYGLSFLGADLAGVVFCTGTHAAVQFRYKGPRGLRPSPEPVAWQGSKEGCQITHNGIERCRLFLQRFKLLPF